MQIPHLNFYSFHYDWENILKQKYNFNKKKGDKENIYMFSFYNQEGENLKPLFLNIFLKILVVIQPIYSLW